MPPKRQKPAQVSNGQASEPEPSAKASSSSSHWQAGASSDVTCGDKRKSPDEDSNYEQPEDASDSEHYVISKPKRQKASAKKAAVRKPTAPKPSATKPAATKPAAPKPAAPKPTTKQPAAQKPAASAPTSRTSNNGINGSANGSTDNEANGHADNKVDTTGIDRSLPPITNVEEAFQDLVQNKPKPASDELAVAGGFKIRVATMCSGTDAPIFALELINKAFTTSNPNHHHLLEIEHVFSVENVDWKAAFIHRNASSMVFSDVRDFGSEQSEAYVYYFTLSCLFYY